RCAHLERLQAGGEAAQHPIAEAGAHASDVHEASVGGFAQYQGPESRAASFRIGIAHDGEIAGLQAFHLEPVPASARPIEARRALRDESLQTRCAGLLEEVFPLALDMVGVANGSA